MVLSLWANEYYRRCRGLGVSIVYPQKVAFAHLCTFHPRSAYTPSLPHHVVVVLHTSRRLAYCIHTFFFSRLVLSSGSETVGRQRKCKCAPPAGPGAHLLSAGKLLLGAGKLRRVTIPPDPFSPCGGGVPVPSATIDLHRLTSDYIFSGLSYIIFYTKYTDIVDLREV